MRIIVQAITSGECALPLAVASAQAAALAAIHRLPRIWGTQAAKLASVPVRRQTAARLTPWPNAVVDGADCWPMHLRPAALWQHVARNSSRKPTNTAQRRDTSSGAAAITIRGTVPNSITSLPLHLCPCTSIAHGHCCNLLRIYLHLATDDLRSTVSRVWTGIYMCWCPRCKARGYIRNTATTQRYGPRGIDFFDHVPQNDLCYHVSTGTLPHATQWSCSLTQVGAVGMMHGPIYRG